MQLLWNLIAHFLLIKWKLKIIFSYILALSHIDNGTIEKQLSSCLADFVVKQNLPYHPPPLPILNGQYQDENQNQMKNRCK